LRRFRVGELEGRQPLFPFGRSANEHEIIWNDA
jgi:hypothetical protein